MTGPAPHLSPQAGGVPAKDRGPRLVGAMLFAALCGALFTRLVILAICILPLPEVSSPGSLSAALATAKWWAPAIVGVLFAMAEHEERT